MVANIFSIVYIDSKESSSKGNLLANGTRSVRGS